MSRTAHGASRFEAWPELGVLFRDNDLLVVDKPAGLIVHRGWANDRITALRLARHLVGQWVYPAHRLDRGTSGVLVFALSAEIASQLGEQFAANQISKKYYCLVRGWAPSSSCIDHPLAPEKTAEPRAAQTQIIRHHAFELPGDGPYPLRYSWVECRPHTGRAHQIRRHLKHISHPLIGDVRYGKSQHNRYFREHFALNRLALHASELTLQHPRSGQRLTVRAPLAPDLQSTLNQLQALAEVDPTSTPS